MATILGLDIDPHTVRGVVLRTALRKSEVVAYVSVPIPSADEVAAQLGGPTAAAHGPSAPAPQDSATPDGGWVSQAGDDAPAEGEPPGPDAAAHPETGAAGHPAPTEEPATPP
ncbi:MAG TPA: hypothetical protein RMH99_25195, partial [Sandaracinaceae bacterium LLY-WYZ-13_1]|nr:hypothetical protein [Sandaracinaceae bacterium LLY-WYZ-13_1]